jgi:hypothetical protein
MQRSSPIVQQELPRVPPSNPQKSAEHRSVLVTRDNRVTAVCYDRWSALSLAPSALAFTEGSRFMNLIKSSARQDRFSKASSFDMMN